MVSNEVFVGANAQVGFCPELDLFFPKGDVDTSTKTVFTLSSGQQGDTLLVADLYAGCMAKVDKDNTDNETEYRMIVSNTTNTVTLDAAVTSGGTGTHNLTIMAFGAPAYAKKTSGGSPLL